MGIEDRSYMSRREPSGVAGVRTRLGGLRMVSVNTWLIVLCVAVFVADSFLPTRWVWTGKVTDIPQGVSLESIDRGQLTLGPERRDTITRLVQTPRGVRQVKQEVVSRQVMVGKNGTPIGMAELRPMHFLESYLYLSTARIIFGVEFWRLIGFQFLHSHDMLVHILFNMLGLYFFGPLVEQYLGGKRYLAFYLLCGMCGAVMYLLLNVAGIAASSVFGAGARIPGLLFHDVDTPLIGASAGVFGVIMAGAYLAPSATVLVFFVLPMRLATVAYALVAIAAGSLLFGTSNAGGQAAHLGGAAAGWFLIRRPHHLHEFFNVLGRVEPTSRSGRARRAAKAKGVPPVERTEIDRILDKIAQGGVQSLTAAEKRTLRAASGRGD
ncbi:MAG: rhomboid family intramembrane serine protease [Phycisphaerales bacterium]|nr:rhomboid family intramembrane serine protease [Phycisphaerales bacterium]